MKFFDDDGEETEDQENGERRDFKTVQEYTGFFFTQEACELHIKQNAHHYKNPRSYVGYCFRNPEMEGLLKAISDLTGISFKR